MRSLKLLALCGAISASFVSFASHAQVRISGSDSLEGLVDLAVKQYQRDHKVEFKEEFKGTNAGLKDLCEGKADIVPASGKISAEQAKVCADKKITYLELPIAYDAVAVIINKGNTWATDLTMAELKTIFHPEMTGKTTRWSQVRAGFADAPLKVVSLDTKSGTNAFFSDHVTGMKGFIRGDASAFADHDKAIDAVSADINAVGFVSLGKWLERKAGARPVAVNFGKGAVIPDASSVMSEAYGPLTRLTYLYIARSALDKPDSKAFASYIVENAARYARFGGFVPLLDANYLEALGRVQSGKVGPWR